MSIKDVEKTALKVQNCLANKKIIVNPFQYNILRKYLNLITM